MPGVKKLFPESEKSAKPEYIHGHMFGGLGILAGSAGQRACIPLSIRLHDGLKAAAGWNGACICAASHVVQMIEDAYRSACIPRDCLLLLDRYFLTVPALEKLAALNRNGEVHMEIVTKARRSCIAFEKPAPRKAGRGRPPKKGLLSTCRNYSSPIKRISRRQRSNSMAGKNPYVTTALICCGDRSCIRSCALFRWK